MKIFERIEDEQLQDYAKAIIPALIMLVVGWAFMVVLLSMDNTLKDIRSIDSEARDSQNCLTWPNDPACN